MTSGEEEAGPTEMGVADGRVKGKGGAPVWFDAERRGVFLGALRESCHLGRAAATAGVASSTVYAHRNRDPAFRAAMVEALADGAERLPYEMLDRAIEAAALPQAQDAGGRTNSWLAARLSSVPASGPGGGGAGGDGRRTRALPRAEVDRRLLEAVERLGRVSEVRR